LEAIYLNFFLKKNKTFIKTILKTKSFYTKKEFLLKDE